MTIMAAVCGIMIVLLGLWSTGRSPTEVQLAVEITCLVGGLILCFLSVVLARLAALTKRMELFGEAIQPGE
ncbi:hypothetical protein [Lichenihabitans psoromatis]|uniref:hypothetical protein n=1 Tax=Lichenihabitans psoromatis TaxID=2528642 RepID=UPI0010365114|nr:hypothetical protein [Lichenihabitans psoromatis]